MEQSQKLHDNCENKQRSGMIETVNFGLTRSLLKSRRWVKNAGSRPHLIEYSTVERKIEQTK